MPEREQQRTEIRVVVYREGDHYVAQGLEFDICVQAGSLDELQERFSRTAFATLAVCLERGTDPREAVPRAPAEFWEMFEEAKVQLTRADVRSQQDHSPVVVPAFRWHERRAA
jgi:hypothetical protein